MMSAPRLDALIEENSELHGGRPVIAGTGTTIHMIAGMNKLGLNAEGIAMRLTYLNLAQVYAALAYYHLHLDEIDAEIAADSEENLKRSRSMS